MYTWANNLEEPTYEKLDMVLVTSKWDIAYPLATVVGLNRKLSDHVPLHLNTGVDAPHSDMFTFQTCWFEREGFREVAQNSWNECYYLLQI